MYKKLLTALLLMLIFMSPNFAASNSDQLVNQKKSKTLIDEYLKKNQDILKLTDDDVSNWIFSDFYVDQKSGVTHAYMQQTIDGIKIFNGISSIAIKNNQVVSFAKRIVPNAKGNANTSVASISPKTAVQNAVEHLGLKFSEELQLITSNNSTHNYIFSKGGLSLTTIKVDLVFLPINQQIRLAYNVNLRLIDGSHWWNIRIDAATGNYLNKNDWTVSCDFGQPEVKEPSPAKSLSVPYRRASGNSTNAVASYRVYPFPLEAPSFGSSVLVTDPSDATASPFGWHDTDGISGPEYTITRGNNVFAYDDIANIDAPGTSADGTASLTFDFPINFTQQPSTYTDAANVNLFYVNNIIHDYLVHYGFDEAAGNFQETNYSGNGAGTDYVIAESQDGGGTNNANFSTPNDGQNGRMQMYLWSGNTSSTFIINSPAGIAGSYTVVGAGFGPSVTVPITQDIALVDDGAAPNSDACTPLINGVDVNGKIALLDRGVCNFVDKVLAAQNAGAVAAIVINNIASAPFAMGDNGNGASVTIPSVMISQADGNLIRTTLTSGAVNGTLNPPSTAPVAIDGSLDNGIVTHEFGHGISNRLTGGPNNSSCLGNGEQGGEGWSDWFALMFTAKVGDLGVNARGVGTFALGEIPTGAGIRRYPYSTDMSIDPETYSFLAVSGEVHDIGEVWCTVLWDLNWALVDLNGFDPDWINGTSGNNIAMHLVMEGMKLQPCGPGFLDSRDAILAADDNLYGGIHKCLIWQVFARRGMGFNASQGSANTAGDETEDFSIPTFCQSPVTAPIAQFTADVTTTCFGIVHFTDQSTNIPQQWSWDFGDGGVSALQNPTHTYTSPGTYTVVLTVTNTIGIDAMTKTSYISITLDPAPTVSGTTTICPSATTTLTAAVTPGNIAEWYDNLNNLVSNTLTFTTPSLVSNTNYTVRQLTPTPLQNVGPVNNTFAAGGYHNTSFEGKEYFTTYGPMRLMSVLVYATGTTDRTFNLYNSTGILIQSRTISVPDGQSRVTLNFDIQTPGDYQLGVSAGSNLYRNNAGASYPYTIAGLVSITSSNSTSNLLTYYYYSYDWQVQVLPCSSAPAIVAVTVVNPTSSYTYSAVGLTVSFTNTSAGNITSYSWNFGDGNTSTVVNPVHVFTADGTYTIILHIETTEGCTADYAQVITISANGVTEISNQNIFITGKNDQFSIQFNHPAKDAQIRVTDALGQIIFSEIFNKGTLFSRTINNLATSFIVVSVTENGQSISKKIVVNKRD